MSPSVPGLPVHLDTTSSIPLVFHAIQRASRMLKKPSMGRKLLFGLSRLLVKQDQLDEQNKPDEPDRPVSRARSLSAAHYSGPVEK